MITIKRLATMTTIISISYVSGCQVSSLTPQQQFVVARDRLATVRIGTPISELFESLKLPQPTQESGSSGLYFFSTYYAQTSEADLAVGGIMSTYSPEGTDTGILVPRFAGHYILQIGNYKAIRWIYSDGMLFDHNNVDATK